MDPVTLVYLDFDGVLLPLGGPALDANGMPLRGGESIPAFNRLVASIRCEVIITSTWRIDRSVEALEQMIRRWGIEATVSGVTPVLGDRLEEIRAHAEGRPECRVVVLDDEVLDAPREWFVVRPAAHRGLREGEIEELLSRLH